MDTVTDDGSVGSLVRALQHWFDRLWPDAERGARARAALEPWAADPAPRTADAVAAVEEAGRRHSRHLALEHDPGSPRVPDTDPPGWTPQDPGTVRRRAAYVRAVTRRDDGIAVLRLDGLDPVHLAAPHLEPALELVATADAVVLDLSDNGGGDPATLALVLDWVRGPARAHVSDVHSRDRVVQWWTPGRPAGRALPATTPLAVVTSTRTFSSGEALAFHLQQLCGVPVVGETTRGAADHVTPVRVTRDVTAYLPEAYTVDRASGTNWEGVGVRPDATPPPGTSAVDHAVATVLDAPPRR